MPDRESALFRGVDLAAFATALSRRLRVAGVDVDLTRTEAFTRALIAVPPGQSARQLYWCARVCLVRREADLAVFDRVFADVFDLETAAIDRRPRRRGQRRGPAASPPNAGTVRPPGAAGDHAGEGLPWATLTARPEALDATGEPPGRMIPELLPSDVAALADEPFEALDEADLRLLSAWLARARGQWPRRRTRRERWGPRGRRVALRPTLARARSTGFEALELTRARPAHRPRRLVLVCDVSQSMQAYTRAYLHVMRAAAVAADSEVFAFATGLTRLTGALRHTSTEAAVAHAGEQVGDRFGGTRIAANLTALIGSRHGGLLRGSIVVIASDGWDSAPPAELASAMLRLRRRAHAVVWLNPRAGAPGFEPRVGPMAAALPYCDEFRSAHTLHSLRETLDCLAALRVR